MSEMLCKTIDYYTEVDGILPFLFSIRDCIPIAYPSLLIVIFFIIFGGNYYLVKGKTGKGKVLIALSSSSFIMVILTMFLALSSLVTYTFLLFWTFVSIVSFIGLIVSDKY
jgi:hypothetical protein